VSGDNVTVVGVSTRPSLRDAYDRFRVKLSIGSSEVAELLLSSRSSQRALSHPTVPRV